MNVAVQSLAPDLTKHFEPERRLRERRAAQDKMYAMIHRIEDEAKQTQKLRVIAGENFYIAHNTKHFVVYRKGHGICKTDKFVHVVTMFTPEAFVEGFCSLNNR